MAVPFLLQLVDTDSIRQLQLCHKFLTENAIRNAPLLGTFHHGEMFPLFIQRLFIKYSILAPVQTSNVFILHILRWQIDKNIHERYY